MYLAVLRVSSASGDTTELLARHRVSAEGAWKPGDVYGPGYVMHTSGFSVTMAPVVASSVAFGVWLRTSAPALASGQRRGLRAAVLTDTHQFPNGRREPHVYATVTHSLARTAVASAIAWLALAGLLAVQFWPAVPTTTRAWAFFVVLGPPTCLLVEGAASRLWATRAGRALSRHPSVTVRIVGGVVVLGAVLTAYVGGLWLLGRSV